MDLFEVIAELAQLETYRLLGLPGVLEPARVAFLPPKTAHGYAAPTRR